MSHELLAAGTKAPLITSKDQDGNVFKLDDYKGNKVVLFFYPKDDTSGCTKEACNLRDNYELLLKKGLKIVGISADDEKSHQKFIKKFDLPFPLIADTDKKVVNDYKVWAEKSLYGRKYMGILRVTYVLDEAGKIILVIDKVNTEKHAEQILELMDL